MPERRPSRPGGRPSGGPRPRPPQAQRPHSNHDHARKDRPASTGKPRPGASGRPRSFQAGRPAQPQARQDDRRGPEGAPTHGPERLQKVLAHAGVASRRECEDMILQGRVEVDGITIRELGTKVDPSKSKISVDGQRVKLEPLVYYAVHKPSGVVSTNNDPAGRPRVVDLLPEIPQRVYTVGRLDEASTGLILLTNDGDLANKLAHPKYGVEKVYRAVVAGTPTPETLEKVTEGVWLAEGKARAKRVRIVGRRGDAAILEMVLAEGKNREVRRMLAKLGHKVMSLIRIAVGPVLLKGIAPGQSRPLNSYEVGLLRKVAAGIPIKTREHEEPRTSQRGPARHGIAPTPSKDTTSTPREARVEGPGGPRPAYQSNAPRPQGPGGPRPAYQSNGPRPQGPGGPRPAYQSNGPRPQGPGGPRPTAGKRPPGPLARRKPGGPTSPPPENDVPRRKIIGLDVQSGPTRPGAPMIKPGKKLRAPRASLGLKRTPDADAEG